MNYLKEIISIIPSEFQMKKSQQIFWIICIAKIIYAAIDW